MLNTFHHYSYTSSGVTNIIIKSVTKNTLKFEINTGHHKIQQSTITQKFTPSDNGTKPYSTKYKFTINKTTNVIRFNIDINLGFFLIISKIIIWIIRNNIEIIKKKAIIKTTPNAPVSWG